MSKAEAIQGEPECTNANIAESNDSYSDSGINADPELRESNRYWPPPTSESIKLVASFSQKTTSALAFNHAGSRFAAGGHDHEVRIWDFEAMETGRLDSICNNQPCGQTIIKSLDYSNDDELILVISGGCQATIMAKDGIVAKHYQCPKGDQYLSDMSHTKGHTQMLNDGCWNPKDKRHFITCSNDCTVRLWDLNATVQQSAVIKTRSQITGLKAIANVCRYTRDALSIVAGCNDGSVMMWDTRRKFISTSACIKNAHLKGSEITSVDFSHSLGRICSRGEDESCKVWDSRQLKTPLASRTGLTTLYPTTDCAFSPDDSIIITGTSKIKQEPGQLLLLDSNDLSIKQSIETDASVIRTRWHPRINHIGYSCSDGSVNIAYDRLKSMGGFLASEMRAGKGNKRKRYVGKSETALVLSSKKIVTPHALPLFRDDPASSSFAKLRQDPKRSYKPEMPVIGASQGGRVKPSGSTLSSYVARNIAKPIDDGGMDIRERILRHADEAAKKPMWVKPDEKD